jgi:hypothetical protein
MPHPELAIKEEISVVTSPIPAPITAPNGPAIVPAAANAPTTEPAVAPAACVMVAPSAAPGLLALPPNPNGMGRKYGLSAMAYIIVCSPWPAQ